MRKPRLTKRQQYYTNAKGLPLFKQFNRDDYVQWVDDHEREFLRLKNKKAIIGIKQYEEFNDYLRIASDNELRELQKMQGEI